MAPLDFDFLKNRYDSELQRKEQITTAVAFPVGVLGGLGSLLAVMVRSFTFQRTVTSWIFGIVIAAAVGAFFTCMVQLGRVYHRQTYKYLPLLKELDAKLKEWQEFYEREGHPGAENDFFAQGLRADIIDAADRNTENNDARSSSLYWARVSLFWVLGFTTVAGIVYVVNHL